MRVWVCAVVFAFTVFPGLAGAQEKEPVIQVQLKDFNRGVKGTLAKEDARDTVLKASNRKVYEIKLNTTEAAFACITMHSSKFDPYLRIETPEGKIIDERGSSGKSYTWVTFGGKEGTYRIIATSVKEAVGEFTLSDVKHNLIFVPTPVRVVEKMLDMAKVTRDDVVYDLGCGEGTIVAIAAKRHGARGVGVDINPNRIKESNETVAKYGVEKLVEIRHGDGLAVNDLEKATVVALYGLPQYMAMLEPLVQKKLKPGSRVVMHEYRFPNWQPDEEIEFQGPDRKHRLYLYTVKKRDEK